MDRFFTDVDPKGLAFIKEDFKHLRAKRVSVGETVEVIDRKTFKPFVGEVLKIEKKSAVVKIVEELKPNVPKFFIRLYQCVPVKISTFDEIVEKSTQIGVSEIVPVISKRSFQKLSVIKEKIGRWERVALGSLKQCGRHQPLKISQPVSLEDLPTEGDFLNLFPFERERSQTVLEVLKGKTKPGGVNILIGPEGGFSEEEFLTLKEKGFIPVSLGNFVLKSETAATVAAGIVYNYWA